MNYNVQINALDTIDEIPNYWTINDYQQLLELFDFPDAKSVKEENLLGMLQMAISDFEPADAARILLQYKLSEDLNDGQMDQLSHEMLLDKISEEYPNISLHYKLFNINQFLFKAFNGVFPNAKASILDFNIVNNEENVAFTEAQVLRILHKGFSSSNLIIRLFEEKLTSDEDFEDAESIIWEIKTEDNRNYKLITSEYWLSRDDIATPEFEGILPE